MAIRRKKIKGFTVIEMMVTLTIIIILLTMVLVYNRGAEKINSLNRAVNKIRFELRRVQELAMLVWQSSAAEKKICGWGLYFPQEEPDHFIVFHDHCLPEQSEGDEKYTEEEAVENIHLKDVIISSSNINSLCFVPPEPKLYFTPDLGGNYAELTLCLKQQENVCYKITISPSGQFNKSLVNSG